MTRAPNPPLRFFGNPFRRAAAAAAALLAVAGCRADYPPTVPVRGRVTYNGGAWPTEGTIYFLPEKAADGHTHHAGMAPFGRDGTFTVRTFRAGDGLAPGTYVVRIECWKVPPSMGGPPPESHLPPDYQTGRRELPNLVVEPGARRVWFEYDVGAEGHVPQTRSVRPAIGPTAFCAKMSGGSAACARRATTPDFPTTAPILRRRT